MNPHHDASPETAPQGRFAKTVSRNHALTGLLILAVGYTLYIAADVLIPITMAVLLNVLFSPLVRRLARRGIPRSISTAFLVLSMVGFSVFTINLLAGPAEQWLHDAPRSIRQLQNQTHGAKGKLANIQALAEEVDELTTVEPGKKAAQPVVVKGPGMLEGMVGGLPTLAVGGAIVIFLTYFLLASGDGMLRKVTLCGRTWTERRRIVTILRRIHAELSRYLATVAVINMLLGAATALAMHWLNVPNPLLWGAMVTVFNFAPYIGALASGLVLTVVGLTSFPTLSEGLMVPAVFFCLTILEGQLITPTVLGKRLYLSSTVVFLAVVAWGWMWGIAGALMAVPIVTSFKVMCDHVPQWAFIGTFLEGEESSPVVRTKQPVAGNDNSQPSVKEPV